MQLRYYLLLLAGTLACNPIGSPDDDAATAPSENVSPVVATMRSDPPTQAFFFPLEIGNTWTYSAVFNVDDELYATRWEEHELTGTEEVFGRPYVQERIDITETVDGDTDESAWWVRYRQDRAGLYEADIPWTDPPASAATSNAADLRKSAKTGSLVQRISKKIDWSSRSPEYRAGLLRNLRLHEMIRTAARDLGQASTPPGGIMTGEITRLAYPLHVGREWILRDDPLFTSTVEGHEMLDLPAGRRVGIRIRIDSELFGPDDEAYVWYSRDGLLRLHALLAVDLVGPEGTPLGKLITEENQVLEQADVQH